MIEPRYEVVVKQERHEVYAMGMAHMQYKSGKVYTVYRRNGYEVSGIRAYELPDALLQYTRNLLLRKLRGC